MLVHEEKICNRDLDNSLTDSASESTDNVGANDVPSSVHFRLPDTRSELKCSAEEIERSPAICMNEWNEDDASHTQRSVVHSGRVVEQVDREAELLNDGSPCCETHVELDERPEDVPADDAVVQGLAELRPILDRSASSRATDQLILPMDHWGLRTVQGED